MIRKKKEAVIKNMKPGKRKGPQGPYLIYLTSLLRKIAHPPRVNAAI